MEKKILQGLGKYGSCVLSRKWNKGFLSIIIMVGEILVYGLRLLFRPLHETEMFFASKEECPLQTAYSAVSLKPDPPVG
jgi:hypothetical protein